VATSKDTKHNNSMKTQISDQLIAKEAPETGAKI